MKILKYTTYILLMILMVSIFSYLKEVNYSNNMFVKETKPYYQLSEKGGLEPLVLNKEYKLRNIAVYNGIEDLLCLGKVGAAEPQDVRSGTTFFNARKQAIDTGTHNCPIYTGNATPNDVKASVTFWNANTNQEETGVMLCPTIPSAAATAADVAQGITFWNTTTNQEEVGTMTGSGYRIVNIGNMNGGGANSNKTVTMTMDIRTLLSNNGIDYTKITTSNFIQYYGHIYMGCNWAGRSVGLTYINFSYNPANGILTRNANIGSYNLGNINAISTPIILVVNN